MSENKEPDAHETYGVGEIICPYCSNIFYPDEGHYYDEANYTSDDCYKCGRTFDVIVETSTVWITRPQENAP